MNCSLPPLIGLSASIDLPDPNRNLFKDKHLHYVEQAMSRVVAEVGGMPVILPVLAVDEASAGVLDRLDGLLITGGTDVAPSHYDEEPQRPEWSGDPVRERYEQALLRRALALDLPVLGICRGCQILNVAPGGRLYQDIDTQVSEAATHRDTELYDSLGHALQIEPGTLLSASAGPGPHWVNSVHHQAIRRVAESLRVSARAPDGVIEAVEAKDNDRFWFGIQWHPEWLDTATPELGIDLMRVFVKRCIARHLEAASRIGGRP
jgi:putative glutamine amidotransferase